MAEFEAAELISLYALHQNQGSARANDDGDVVQHFLPLNLDDD